MAYRNVLNFLFSLAIIYLTFSFMPSVCDIFVKFSVVILAIKLAEWIMTTSRKYFFYDKISCKNKAIFITGCDSGFGHALAMRMNRLGYRVFAGCLFPNGEGAKMLANNCSFKLLVVPLDVTDDRSVDSAKDFVMKNLGNDVLWAIVNNAGVGQAALIDWTPISELEKIFAVNTFGVVRVTKTFLPFLKKSRGRVVNVTSFAGQVCSPGYVGYCMSKSAAVSFTSGLRMEMAIWGIKVISIEPFFYATPITKRETTIDLIEKAWAKNPLNVQEEYGEEYKENLKNKCIRLLAASNPEIDEVVTCLEDAIIAEEPLAAYFPCHFLHKIMIALFRAFPMVAAETLMKACLNRRNKPLALRNYGKESMIRSAKGNDGPTPNGHHKEE
ncbi:short-chain dehydrogenase/reductase family 9C member 7-like isoform X1 [Stegodyphus dumicola]|uniref:short-chain dehydrogenase/reductase family 9C member 7-like isoform X1 n=1 Tax=Stegodyphus dumicola TaxID=202533 RepID=UPI0015AC889F|nr:short-chain dehydrogenase/reductase family 9C member 7-like isoform X1 [Stegodyphus dumicola]